MFLIFIFVSFLLFNQSLWAISENPEKGVFSGRVSSVNFKANFVRVKMDFSNMKYLNKKDKVEFWSENNPEAPCEGRVLGKSNDYLLLKVSEFKLCRQKVALFPGFYLKFFSQDLVNNLKMGKELIKILLKKRLAVAGRLHHQKKELHSHIEEMEAVNSRYKVLRDKLEKEWRDKLAALEEDKLVTLKNYKDLEFRLLDIENKLEKYRIEDFNLKLDRWALDSRLYYRK